VNKLAIGTANFGMHYGYIDSVGKVKPNIVSEILDLAYSNNIDTIDTAQAYGESEIVLGGYLNKNPNKAFNIVSKITNTGDTLSNIKRSLDNLNLECLYGLLIHNFNDYKENTLLLNQIEQSKKNGLVKKIGFSLYYPEDLEFLLEKQIKFDLIQVAYSIFDRRFEKYFSILKNIGIEIHTRSIFLQGLFFRNPDRLGSHFDKIKDKLFRLQTLSKNSGIGISSLCLNYGLLNKYIDKIVIGLDSTDNLSKNLQTLEDQQSVIEKMDYLNEFAENDINILFPHFWKL
jgi:aryl-alcohol dehydrogenase-like predicted oxidoreductase